MGNWRLDNWRLGPEKASRPAPARRAPCGAQPALDGGIDPALTPRVEQQERAGADQPPPSGGAGGQTQRLPRAQARRITGHRSPMARQPQTLQLVRRRRLHPAPDLDHPLRRAGLVCKGQDQPAGGKDFGGGGAGWSTWPPGRQAHRGTLRRAPLWRGLDLSPSRPGSPSPAKAQQGRAEHGQHAG